MIGINNTNYLTNELITRNNFYSIHRTIGILPNIAKLSVTNLDYIRSLDEVRSDPHVHSCIQSRKSGTMAMNWEIIECSNKDMNSIIKCNLEKIDVLGVISNILDAIFYGFQVLEIIWTEDNKGSLIVDSIKPKPMGWFFFDNENNLRFRSRSSANGELLPENKFLVPRHNPKYENPYGDALLGKCYWATTLKNMGFRFWINFLEKYGMPLIIGQYTFPSNPEELATLSQRLNELLNSQTIATPSDVNIDIKDIGQSKSVDLYLQLIKIANAEISKALLSETLTTEMDSGSYAASVTHFKVRREVILGDKFLVEQTMNKLIEYIAKVNNFEFWNLPKFALMEQ